jgi:D-arabinose 1-dehydrogenase-like Zn-dependent alcohol dehydrogenase
MVLGHESSGKVIKVGPNVKNLKEGIVRRSTYFLIKYSFLR